MHAPFRLFVQLPDGTEHRVGFIVIHPSGVVERIRTVPEEGLLSYFDLRGADLDKVRLICKVYDAEYWSNWIDAPRCNECGDAAVVIARISVCGEHASSYGLAVPPAAERPSAPPEITVNVPSEHADDAAHYGLGHAKEQSE